MLAGCGALLLVCLVAGVRIGSIGVSPGSVWHVLADRLTGHPPVGPDAVTGDAVVFRIRLPRVLLAASVGAALNTCGVVVQVLVRNALADPYLLGVSSGASVGATGVLLFGAFSGLGLWSLAVGGMLGAAGAMVLVFVVAQRGGRLVPLQLLLCGVALAVAGLLALARPLNALAQGPDVAASVGIDVARLRVCLFVVVSVMAGIAVAVSGVIGFVGLVVPHIVRLLVGSDHRRILPTAVLFGAAFTVLGDLLARTLVAPQEMPMGVVTAFIGAPMLIWLMRRRARLYGGGG